ncbi:MAG TPA: hypothetical protein DCY13_01160 [Verrucomicrobiales bacterium]|nr:hypothetical protein [Verrucomicrobiales bacterium]
MPEADLSLLFVRPLNQLGLRYLVSGSVAAIVYGEPRMTHDVDFVIFLRDEDIQQLVASFATPEFYVPPAEQIALEVVRPAKGHFNIIHVDTGFKADFYPAGRDAFHGWAFRNAQRMEYCGEPMIVAPPEYVIVRKLQYFREGGSEKHLRDIRAMLAVSNEQIDRAVVEDWVNRLSVAAEWNRAQSEA